ncbi:MAG: ATP-binding cassette domain-containing protein [Chromatiales bacterium]|jgi:peptide/nickel transport system ATP-binding protein
MNPLCEARDISKTFVSGPAWWPGARRHTLALDRVSLRLEPGASLGLVGESGCGKSTLARILIGLELPSKGELLWQGRSTAEFSHTDWRRCWRQVQYVFQDAQGALNPRHTLEQSLMAPLLGLLDMSVKQRHRRLDELLDQVGLARSLRDRFPHELSGGQAQRLVLARALAVQPQVLILDEPVSALDVSIQAQILILLCELRRRLNLTYLFISHDLAVVEQLCDELMVMRQGRVVERGRREQIFLVPQQPYTRALIEAVPVIPRGVSEC